jgi:D-alanine-D-alanine ligase
VNVLVLHNELTADASADELDVVVQRNAVLESLLEQGYQVASLACNLNLESTRQVLTEHRPDVVFNLVESLGRTDRLAPVVCMLLDALEIPYTGNQTDAILATSNKLTAKKRMLEAGLPTPAWRCNVRDSRRSVQPPRLFDPLRRRHSRWILKPVLEHASFAMDDDSVVSVDRANQLSDCLLHREQLVGRPHFAEQYVEGREFNLSLLNGRVLPPAEIEFVDFPLGKPRIVGHLAKWDCNSLEYQRTVRRFRFPAADRALLKELGRLAKRCWSLFGLSGYARVDFRVDAEGQPWILEVNTNPCLSPDAGFAAALDQANIPFASGVSRIVDCVVENDPQLQKIMQANAAHGLSADTPVMDVVSMAAL